MDQNALVTQQIPLALLLVFVQNWLKQQSWFPLISYEKTKVNARLNHLFSIVSTGLTTLGIHYTYSAADHSLTITGLAWSTISVGLWHWVQQYAITKGLYFGLSDKLNPVPVNATVEVGQVKISSTDIQKTLGSLTDPYELHSKGEK